jgi:hypothetical protein
MPAPARPAGFVEALVERSAVEGRLSLEQLRDGAGVRRAETA